MKIAIPYDNGQVFQHFGKSEHFKLYDISYEEVTSSEIVDTEGSGHAALADFLAEKGVNALICGGIGAGAVTALQNAKIQIMGGASGEADKQVEDFINGKVHFETSGSCATCASSCGHHHGDGGGDGDEEESDGNISACGNRCF